MTETKIKTIGSFSLDTVGIKKLGISALLSIAAIALGFGLDFLSFIDYGSLSTIAATLLPFVTNIVRKFAGKYNIPLK